MTANPIRRLPALILLVVLALLPLQAWLRLGGDEVLARSSTDGLRDVRWVGAVREDGVVSVRITYDFGDDEARTLDVRAPEGARFLAVDGTPIAADIGRYATVEVRGEATVTYELPGRVTRYGDGVLVRFAGLYDGDYPDGDQALFPCPRCYVEPVGYGDVPVDGALHHGGGDGGDGAELWFNGLRSVRSAEDPGVVRFVGVGDGSDVSMMAVLPADAAPAAPAGDGSAAGAADAVREDFGDADESFRGPSGGDGGGIVTALALTAMFLAVCTWIGWRLRRAAAERAEVDVLDATDDRRGLDAVLSRPSDLEPALAALTVGGAGPGDRSAVAGTLLELARRGVISIDGVDSRRFTLTVPAGATGATKIEETVLAQLRPQGQRSATATLTGPPLWGPQADRAARAIGRVVMAEGLRRRLTRFTLSALVLVPASIAMGIVAVIGSNGLSWLGWFAVFGGPVLALLAGLLSGLSLTARGRAERREWMRYAAWLRENSELEGVGAPGVATWGEVLPHAAALGAAPVAARSLSPREGA